MKYYIDCDKTLGKQVVLVDVHPWYEYVDGKVTNKLLGVRLMTVVLTQQFAHVVVKVRNGDINKYKKMIEDNENHMPQVVLVNPEANVYSFANKLGLSVFADDVRE
jgi:hypothetical protein